MNDPTQLPPESQTPPVAQPDEPGIQPVNKEQLAPTEASGGAVSVDQSTVNGERPTAIEEPSSPILPASSDQKPPENTTTVPGGLSGEPQQPVATPGSAQPASIETSETSQQETAPALPAQLEASATPSDAESITQERVVERVVEKIVPRELNEEEKEALNRLKLHALRGKGHATRARKKQEAFQKIHAHLKEHGFATNNELQTLCGLGDSTTTRYLKELEAQGQVVKIGRTKGIRWRLCQGNQ